MLQQLIIEPLGVEANKSGQLYSLSPKNALDLAR
jgi:hypothetical protein